MPVKPVLLGWIMYFNVMKIKVMEAAAFRKYRFNKYYKKLTKNDQSLEDGVPWNWYELKNPNT
jgi:hypothetical protein